MFRVEYWNQTNIYGKKWYNKNNYLVDIQRKTFEFHFETENDKDSVTDIYYARTIVLHFYFRRENSNRRPTKALIKQSKFPYIIYHTAPYELKASGHPAYRLL